MADINEYLDGLDMKFSEQEKQLADIFAESWEYCRLHTCEDCEYRPNGKHFKVLLCMSCQYAKRLIAADVAPVKHGHWILTKRTKLVPTDKVGIKESFASSPINGTFVDENNINQKAMIMKKRITIIKPKCSECGYYGYDEDDITPYCPNCGCKLDNESEEK